MQVLTCLCAERFVPFAGTLRSLVGIFCAPLAGNVDAVCFNIKGFRSSQCAGGQPFGERGKEKNSRKKRTFPPFPYGLFPPLPLFPSPLSPIVRFFSWNRVTGLIGKRNVTSRWESGLIRLKAFGALVERPHHPRFVSSETRG